MNANFSGFDYLVLIIYIVGIVFVGALFSKKQHNIKDFFLAGRKMPWWAVCLSIFSTNLSAISFIGVAGWIILKDVKYHAGAILYPLIMIAVVIIFIPVFYRAQIYTVFEYLEKRFSPLVRNIAVILFIIVKCLWLGAVIYIPSLVLAHVVGWNIYLSIILVGILGTSYTYLGGMKAVIWTDVIQFFVFAGGLLLICISLAGHFNWNVAEMWHVAGQHVSAKTGSPSTVWHDSSFDLSKEATIWSILAFYFAGTLINFGTDQVVVQRYFTIGSFRGIVKAVLGNGIVSLIMCAFLIFAGIGLVAYMQLTPGVFDSMTRTDEIMPHYVVTHMAPGLRGLIIAAIFAATMSSIDSCIHSLSTSSIIDFYKRYFHNANKDAKHYLTAARYFIVFWGAIATVLGLYIAAISGKSTIFQTLGEITSYFGGPLGAIFLVGIITKRANASGVLIGVLFGVAFAFVISQDSLMQRVIGTEINWMWRCPFSMVASFIVAYFSSMFFPSNGKELAQQI